MSGIFGVYHLDGCPIDRSVVDQMSTVLRHRGPDGSGAWRDGCVALGHRLLWTTPESLVERQPLANEPKELIITADARIDNRDELLAILNLNNRPHQQITDSELILGAYEVWGEGCAGRLLGDFAFAIWDRRRQRLFCARDHFGLKPFYFHKSHSAFIFASEIKAIFCVPGVPRRLNDVRVGDFLAKSGDKTSTFYQDVVRLPPAHQIIVDSSGSQIERYWAPYANGELRLRSDNEYVDAFREVFTTAVRCRLRSAFPVGSTLSGGLDSSSIVCTAAKVLGEQNDKRLHTFSAIFPSLVKVDPRIDERSFINAILETNRFEPHFIHADQLSPLVKSFWQQDEVVPGVNLYMDHAFFATAQQHGVRIVLSGHDGDTIVSHGYELLAHLVWTLRWQALLREGKALAQRLGVRQRSVIWHLGVKPLMLREIAELCGNLPGQHPHSWLADTAISPVFAQRIKLEERIKYLSYRHGATTPWEEHWQGIDSANLLYVTEVLDNLAAQFSIEPRHPFFDKRLIELCLALPLEQKLQQGWPRSILRRAMTDLLPEKVRERISKGDLSANFTLGLLKKEHAILEDVILHRSEILQGYVDIPELQRMYRRYSSQPLQHKQDALTINFAIMLALWLQHSRLAPMS